MLFSPADARRTMLLSKDISHPKTGIIKHLQILEVAKNLNMVLDVSLKDSSNPQPYVSSPLTLPPYDSLSPTPSPDTSPPFCVYPPPLSPSTTIPSPTPPLPSYSSPPLGPIETTPPPFAIIPSPPSVLPGPTTSIPSPYSPIPNPPYYEPSPPSGGNIPSPPESPIGVTPGPPIFLPPVVFPPPVKPLTPPMIGGGGGGEQRTWCVAKPSVPDPILQEALNYACGSGADCGPIQPNGQCYQPNSLLAHASYAFNSYWQRTKVLKIAILLATSHKK
ncbi:hypothetical protein Cgig2_026094 [Carnegiea gigantea]|uniref:X8 domain-containing protein n=1 Tax=Carnegiea gigantea TaxID=171969 RepID=A0A9Q1QKM0_9CARY|nr:hypothetical protein Cgig2_026094 [Carnegiea gigantea]